MGFGYIEELVTPTGGYRHLRSPYITTHRESPACPAHGAFTVLEYDFAARAMMTDDRPVCWRCLRIWRAYVEWQVKVATERLDELERSSAAP